jgi:putative transposase
MPRTRTPDAPRVVYRTARCGLRVTRGQRRRLFGLLASAGDVWCCVLELNGWRRRRQDTPLAGYQELCRELAAAGPGTFGELDSVGARSVLRRVSDAWFAAAKRRRAGEESARFPRRKRGLVPVRWYRGTFELRGRRLRLPVARGCPPLWARLDRDPPYPADRVRSVTLLCEAGRLYVEVTAEVPVVVYPGGREPDPARVAGVDLGVIHPYAAAGSNGEMLLVSGRAIRAECYQHLRDVKARNRAAARRAPRPEAIVQHGSRRRGSRRWRAHLDRQRAAQARHVRRVRQSQDEAAREVIRWAVSNRIGVLAVGDPRGVLDVAAGRRHNQRMRDWRVGRLIGVLSDKAQVAGIAVRLVDERGTSSICPACKRRVNKPRGRVFNCPHCEYTGHRDLIAAANIAARGGGGNIPLITAGITHRRAGTNLPGAHSARRDPRRRHHYGPSQVPWPAPARPGQHLLPEQSLASRRGAPKPDSLRRLACEQVH